MKKVVLDSATISKLSSSGSLELYDPAGHFFGFFVLAGNRKVSLRDWAALLFSD
ncbi:MAG: hypothetical protein K8T91_13845 [Planctomycetes bacterium]|nr:hypothetical protein [Planctomycetota bacterium]